MRFILWIIVGGLIGWLASIVMKTNAQMGLIANILVGIVGGALGGWVAGQVGLATSGLGSFVVALLGAIVLIAILRALGVFK